MIKFINRIMRNICQMETKEVIVPAQGKIHLTSEEQRFFQDLKQVVEKKGCGTELRVAGGWVRDKLLGLLSTDIDIALDNMMGEPFARLVMESIPSIRGLGTIKANPQASKHLETACARIHGLDIDFVNLRSEDYCEDSRIPSMQIGTPSEDAHRRDLTINSLFYNIHKDTIEDFTGNGLQDLFSRVARTPLPPKQTFLDDPLRVLRTIRFAARYDLAIAEEIHEAALDPEIVEALCKKVSRERISKEYQLMMKGNNQIKALKLLNDYNLLNVIFLLPENMQNLLPDGYEIAVELVPEESPTDSFYLYTAAILSQYHNAQEFSVPKKRSFYPLFEHICCESLKLSNNDSKVISGILSNLSTGMEVLRSQDLVKTGFMIRETKEYWRLVLKLGEAMLGTQGLKESLTEFITQSNLQTFYSEKPIVDGGEVKRTVGVNGPDIGKMLQAAISWQILNRNGTKEQLVEFLIQNKHNITSSS